MAEIGNGSAGPRGKQIPPVATVRSRKPVSNPPLRLRRGLSFGDADQERERWKGPAYPGTSRIRPTQPETPKKCWPCCCAISRRARENVWSRSLAEGGEVMQWTREDIFMVAERACFPIAPGPASRGRDPSRRPGGSGSGRYLLPETRLANCISGALGFRSGAPRSVHWHHSTRKHAENPHRGLAAATAGATKPMRRIRWLASYAPSGRLRRLALLAESNSLSAGSNFSKSTPDNLSVRQGN